jgi:hypothetical protein
VLTWVKQTERRLAIGRSWGVYVRFGRISITKKFDNLRQAMQRYNKLMSRKKKADIWFAIIPIYDKY